MEGGALRRSTNFHEGPYQPEGSRSSPLHLSCRAGGRRHYNVATDVAAGWGEVAGSAQTLESVWDAQLA